MTTKDELTAALRGLSEDLFAAWPNPASVEGPGQQLALYLALRARSTYDSIVLLLNDGRHDESVVLYRRLLEDSLRAAYVRRNPERADGLCIRLEMDALNDSIRNLEKVQGKHPQVDNMLAERRRDRSDIDRMIQETGIRPRGFPSPAQIAEQTGRAGDPLSYGASSYVSHSAFSPMLGGYHIRDGETTLVGLLSENLHDRAVLGRAAAQAFVLLLTEVSVFLNLKGIPGHIAQVWNPWHRGFIRANGLATEIMNWPVIGS